MPQRLSLSGFWPLLSTVPTNALINAADGARLCRSDCVGWVRSHGSVHQAGGGRCCASRSRILPRRRLIATRAKPLTVKTSPPPVKARPHSPGAMAPVTHMAAPSTRDSKFAAQTFRHAPRLEPDPVGQHVLCGRTELRLQTLGRLFATTHGSNAAFRARVRSKALPRRCSSRGFRWWGRPGSPARR